MTSVTLSKYLREPPSLDTAALPRLPKPEGLHAHPQAASAAKVAADSARDAQPAAQSGKQAAGDTAAAVKDAAPGGDAGDIFGQIASAAKGAVPDAPKDAAKDAARDAAKAVRDVAPPLPAAPKEAVQVGFPSPAPFPAFQADPSLLLWTYSASITLAALYANLLNINCKPRISNRILPERPLLAQIDGFGWASASAA